MTFWFAFYKQNYRTIDSGLNGNESVSDFRNRRRFLKDLDSFKPQYMITGNPEVWGIKPIWKGPGHDADSVVTARGKLVGEIPTNCYGDLRIYSLSR